MKTLIAIPCMDMIQTQFVRSLLSLRITGECQISFGVGSLVYDSRNQLAGKAINEGFDRVLWLDSDMTFGPDLMERLSQRLDEGREFVSGLYFRRKKPLLPCLFSAVAPEGPVAEPIEAYEPDSVFQIAGAGFGAVMMTTDLIRRVGEKYGYPFSPVIALAEDLSFCWRAGQLGAALWCDSSIKLGHVGYFEITEDTYKRMEGEPV